MARGLTWTGTAHKATKGVTNNRSVQIVYEENELNELGSGEGSNALEGGRSFRAVEGLAAARAAAGRECWCERAYIND